MHPLRRYLREVQEPVQEFAVRVGASRQTLYRIIGGKQAPKPALARRIVEATGGTVPLDALYKSGAVNAGAVVVMLSDKNETLLETARLRQAIAMVVDHMTPPDSPEPPEDASSIAAEAVANTYSALSKVTTRQGPDRLRQALRPVLEEILQEFGASPPSASALDRGTELAAQIYYQTWRPAQKR
ncbi:MAG: hypothetical protein DHS20C05_24880 [Hyphococcus sp.]|nr:MAG: hypothetical protein DHS20C05_24880 [Marinicaulis sp.]